MWSVHFDESKLSAAERKGVRYWSLVARLRLASGHGYTIDTCAPDLVVRADDFAPEVFTCRFEAVGTGQENRTVVRRLPLSATRATELRSPRRPTRPTRHAMVAGTAVSASAFAAAGQSQMMW